MCVCVSVCFHYIKLPLSIINFRQYTHKKKIDIINIWLLYNFNQDIYQMHTRKNNCIIIRYLSMILISLSENTFCHTTNIKNQFINRSHYIHKLYLLCYIPNTIVFKLYINFISEQTNYVIIFNELQQKIVYAISFNQLII